MNKTIEDTQVGEIITCRCNDPACEKHGKIDEETGHIEDCPCGECHNHYH